MHTNGHKHDWLKCDSKKTGNVLKQWESERDLKALSWIAASQRVKMLKRLSWDDVCWPPHDQMKSLSLSSMSNICSVYKLAALCLLTKKACVCSVCVCADDVTFRIAWWLQWSPHLAPVDKSIPILLSLHRCIANAQFSCVFVKHVTEYISASGGNDHNHHKQLLVQFKCVTSSYLISSTHHRTPLIDS
jgi:hypothetical protein